MIKLVILDIDGVMTDGTKVYDQTGKVIAKSFNDKDWTAIKKLKAAGVSVCFLSGDNNINKIVAEDRNIDFYHSMTDDKELNKGSWLPKLYEKYGADFDSTVYVGDDYFDLEIINKMKYTFCPMDAPRDVQDAVYMMLGRRGGEGCIVSLVEYLESYKMINWYSYEVVKHIDKQEKR